MPIDEGGVSMRFHRVRMENFKCYGEADLRLDRGVTVIHGLNGSGKSSLLEACFFALYGTKALDENLADIVSIGAEDATVELWFTHGGGDFHIERRVRATGERASTAKCVLETPEGSFDGARDVRRRVTELLRMDSDAFVNCAYVRQGEVNKLINASPGERQDMLDDLLQLGKLEDYRERASDARVGVGRVRDDKQGALSQIEEQITQKENRDLHDRLNALRTEISETTEEIERIESQREQAVATRDDAQSVIDEYEEKQAELDDIESDVAELRERIAETEQERDEIDEQIRQRREALTETEAALDDAVADSDLDEADSDTVDARIDELETRDDELRDRIEAQRVTASEHSNEAERLSEQAGDLSERASEKRTRADDLESDLTDRREDIAQRREKIEEIDEKIAMLRARFEDAPVDRDGVAEFREGITEDLDEARQRVTELETTLENEREDLTEAQNLREAGKCPECGQDVDGSPHVERIGDHRERIDALEDDLAAARETVEQLEDRLERAEKLAEAATQIEQLETNRENVRQLVDEREDGLADDEQRVTELRETAEELDAEAEEKREAAEKATEQADDCRSVVAECNQERQQLTSTLERVERIQTLLSEADSIEDDLERLREQRDQKGEVNDERRERLADKRERKQALEAEFDDETVEQAKSELERATEYIEQADAKLDDLTERRDELQGKAGAVENEIEELEALRDRRDELAATVEKLATLYEEAKSLEGMYGTVRAELRQRNVETLERMLNETFDLVYQNDSYSHIELDGEYELTVYQKDGEALDPEQLSGGERALFNLSLRCAIYRLLAEGIEGSAPMPPLILDEPTVFLDSGHVSQLLDLIEFMRDDVGVEQIVVVSHDEELVGAADALVRVEKDSTTNRSTVEHVDAGVVSQLAD